MEKGILSSQIEALLADKLDEVVKVSGVWEALDGPAFKIVITTVDNNLAEKIPEPYKTQLRDMLTAVLEEKDYEKAAALAAETVDNLVDIPGIDDDTEKFIFTGIFTALVGVLAKIGTSN